jgi:chromosomal replication initiator protein
VENIDALDIWNRACELLQERLSQDVFDRWISVITPERLENASLGLSVSNGFYHSWLEENYLPLIKTAVASVVGYDVDIYFTVDRNAPVPQAKPQQPMMPSYPKADAVQTDAKRALAPAPYRNQTAKQTSLRLNSKYTFDTFIVGPSNNFAHAATLAVAQSPARAYNPLFIYGGVGLGKTHLMQAIGNYAAANNPRLSICYITSESFINEFIEALQRKALVPFRKKYRNTDILLIDDIQFLGGKEQMQEEFFHTFNSLFDNHKQIVMTCDRPASEIPDLEQRLVSRFEWGLVTELDAPNIETRIAILRNKAEAMNIDLEDEVLDYIAQHICSNIRRLEGGLIRAASYASLTGRELTLPMLDHLLRDTFDQEKQKTSLSIEEIQRHVAEYYDIRFSDMASKRRPAAIAFPRQVAMFLCRDLTDYSLPAIGEAFSKNHATVMHACKLIDKRTKEDPGIRQTLTFLRQRLTKKQRS